MSIGAPSQIVIQAEIDYRHERAMAEFHPKPRPQGKRHHLPWSLGRESANQSRRGHAVLG